MKMGLKKLDEIINLDNNNLIVLAGLQETFKSTLALNITTNVAVKQNIPTLVLSLEMSKEQIANWILSLGTGIHIKKIRTQKFTDDEWNKLAEFNANLQEVELYIDDTTNVTIFDIEEKCRKSVKEHNAKFIIIDYMQLIKKGNIEICSKLKAIAKELNITILLLVELNNNVENKEDKRPLLLDLESDVIQNADTIMLLHREDYYYQDNNKDITEINIAKNESDKLGIVKIPTREIFKC